MKVKCTVGFFSKLFGLRVYVPDILETELKFRGRLHQLPRFTDEDEASNVEALCV